jgi:DNA-binding transcriptional MerR regulator
VYTIKEAAARTGVSVALLRAWETRYGIVEPRRTASGYRLYDDDAIERLRSMRALVDAGWSPSVAATAIVSGERPLAAAASGRADSLPDVAAASASNDLRNRFVDAATALEPAAVEAVLDAMFSTGSFEGVVDDLLLPALIEMGEAWEEGRLTVAAEHAASHAVLRRLAAAFQAAGRPSTGPGAVLVGLPPGSRHELGALAFAVAARRVGLPILYLGPDLPVADWVATADRTRAAAAVIATPTAADARPAATVGQALAADPDLALAFGGRAAEAAAGLTRDDHGAAPIVLPGSIREAVDVLLARIRTPAAPT